MKHPVITILALSASGTALCHADFAIPWSTLDAGGGISSGGNFRLSGTIGQPDAAAGGASGRGWTLNGGFWAQPLPGPGQSMLVILPQTDGSATLQWPAGAAGWKLQRSTDMSIWTNVGNNITGAGSINLSPAPGVKREFFRLRYP